MNKPRTIGPFQIDITDVITPKSCSSFISELIKYIAYNKQQIPYPYERLKMFVMKRRECQKSKQLSEGSQGPTTCARETFLMEKYFKKVEEAFEILDSTFKCVEQHLIDSNECSVKEIVLLFGATPISPKDIYRIVIPPLSYGHSEGQHLYKRQIGNLFRGIIISDEINTNLQCKVGLTNMFILMKVKKGDCSKSRWLLPKDHFRLSERAHQVCFTFGSSSSKVCNCFNGHDELHNLTDKLSDLEISGDTDVTSQMNINNTRLSLEPDDQYVWFQVPRTLKGFKDCKSHGKSVTDLWYKYSFIF